MKLLSWASLLSGFARTLHGRLDNLESTTDDNWWVFSECNISANFLYYFLITLVSTSGLSVAARMSHSVGFVGSEVIIDAGQIWIKFFGRFQDFDGHVNILNLEVFFCGVSCLLPCQSYKIFQDTNSGNEVDNNFKSFFKKGKRLPKINKVWRD